MGRTGPSRRTRAPLVAGMGWLTTTFANASCYLAAPTKMVHSTVTLGNGTEPLGRNAPTSVHLLARARALSLPGGGVRCSEELTATPSNDKLGRGMEHIGPPVKTWGQLRATITPLPSTAFVSVSCFLAVGTRR